MSGDAPIAVHEAGAEALDLLVELERRCFSDPWSRADMEPLFDAGAAAVFLALDAAEAPLGYALFQLLPGEVELLAFGVVPEARTRGVGRFLLSSTLERLADSGRPICHLEVRAGNAAARALYERLGFEAIGRRRAYYPDGEDAVRYRRSRPD